MEIRAGANLLQQQVASLALRLIVDKRHQNAQGRGIRLQGGVQLALVQVELALPSDFQASLQRGTRVR